MPVRPLLLLLLFTVPLASLADMDLPDVSLAAETASTVAPVPKAGSFQTFVGKVGTVDCQHWVVTSENDAGYLTSTCGDYTSFLAVDGSYNLHKVVGADGTPVARFSPFLPAVQFPLAVRQGWTGRYDGELPAEGLRWEGEVHCRVMEFSAVTVKAGTFDAFRIECYDKRRAAMLETAANTTYWYAPSVPAVVKTISHEDPRWNNELADYGPR